MNNREIIQKLKLKPHPEGGYYSETYRSELIIGKDNLPSDMQGNRSCSTCIYYLLENDDFSAFHRIKQDEIWHFYSGTEVLIHYISPNGDYGLHLLGNVENGDCKPQIVIPAGYWFAAELCDKTSYALVGCTVSPGFSFEDFELANRTKLAKQFPQHKTIIERMTRK